MIRLHSLLGKKCLCPLFMASATPRERVNPWGQVLQAFKSPPDASASIIRVQSSNVYDTLAYEVQGMLLAQYLLFPVGSSPNNPPETPSGSPIRQISDSSPVKGAN